MCWALAGKYTKSVFQTVKSALTGQFSILNHGIFTIQDLQDVAKTCLNETPLSGHLPFMAISLDGPSK